MIVTLITVGKMLESHSKGKTTDALKGLMKLAPKTAVMLIQEKENFVEKEVPVDQVKKGDLLVKDIVTTDYNNEVYVGTFGSVYAYTWYYVTINEKISDYNKESVFANCLLAIKEEISKNFKDNEYIYEENVLKFNIDKNILNMKVHFTCVEDIAKE